MEWQDLIGKTLDSYTQLESAKITSRIAQTNEQATAYDNPTRSSGVNDTATKTDNKTLLLTAGLIAGVVLVWLAVRT